MLEHIFPGNSELAARMRDLDWSKTDLGSPDEWPENLRGAARLCLTSRIPIVMYWGANFTVLYNDPYISFLGSTKHPRYLGRPGRECWSEIWSTIGPMLQSVYDTKQATWSEDVQMFFARGLPLEEVFVRFTFGPILSVDGQSVDGIFCPCTETTEQVVGGRRLETLRKLGIKATESQTVGDACEAVSAVLAENPRDVPFAAIYTVDDGQSRAKLCGAAGLSDRLALLPRFVSASEDDASPWPLASVMRTRSTHEVSGLDTPGRQFPGGPYPEPARQALVMPIAAAAHDRLAGLLVLGVSPRRLLDASYRTFFDLVAGHLASALADASAYEAERRRAEALAELDRAKTAFFSNVSHEFRTPLTLMLGPVEDLLMRSHTDLPPSAKGQLEIVNRNGLRLLRLVNTLLDFARIEAGRVRAVYEPTDLAGLTAELASNFRAACERAGLRLVVDCPPLQEPVHVDREMWEKIVLNLLSNAFKFTFDGEIAVSLRWADGAAELRVRDTGTGIPAEHMPRLFERFHRVENAQGRTHEGSGIGLALVHDLVQLHGGMVTAESVLGRGTTFTVSVPLGSAHLPADQVGGSRTVTSTATGAAPYVEEALRWLPDEAGVPAEAGGLPPNRDEPPPVPGAEPVKKEGDERPRVLVADDNADMRQYVVRLLAGRYQVEAAPDGAAALAAARERLPDLILTDVMMPRLDGFGLLRELRADPALAGLPVIMLSARAGEESRVEGMEAGADDYLVKPFSSRELLARVGGHLQMARLRRESERALRESREQLRVTLASIGDAVITTNTEGRITYLNAMAESLTGWKNEKAAGQPLEAVFRIRAEPSDRVLIAKDGREISIDDSAAPIQDDGGHVVAGSVVIFRNVSERRRTEKRIDDLMKEMKQADRRKDEFLAMLAHELRGPLAPLGNMIEMMKRREADVSLVQLARDTMERQLKSLVRLVDDLLDVSRITRNKLELRKERVDLASVLHEAVETCRPLAESSRHEVTVTLPREPISLDADPVRLVQVFNNLLNNACKYTEPGGRIGVTVQQQGGDVLVKVKDSGVGIPADKLESVFDMFMQVVPLPERTQGGLGIGLTLVKRLVEMHDGAVGARSDGPGRGSEFVVRLPMARGHAKAPGSVEPTAAGRAVEPCRILVADDNLDSAASLAMLLTMAGNETLTAHDGLEAVTAAEQFRPDVVLLDIGMPKLNGFDACRRIRERSWGKDVVLIALTGWGQEDARRESKEAGFDAHLVKPVDHTALAELLASLHRPEGNTGE